MKVFEANITYQVADYLNFSLKDINSFETANQKLFDAFGITLFLTIMKNWKL